jgi:hypothetical protein
MRVIFELNSKKLVSLEKEKIKLERSSFPIKVTLINNKGKESERIIFIREKKGEPKMMIS